MKKIALLRVWHDGKQRFYNTDKQVVGTITDFEVDGSYVMTSERLTNIVCFLGFTGITALTVFESVNDKVIATNYAVHVPQSYEIK